MEPVTVEVGSLHTPRLESLKLVFQPLHKCLVFCNSIFYWNFTIFTHIKRFNNRDKAHKKQHSLTHAYIYTYIHIHIHTLMHIHIYMHTHTHTYIHTTHTHTYVHHFPLPARCFSHPIPIIASLNTYILNKLKNRN